VQRTAVRSIALSHRRGPGTRQSPRGPSSGTQPDRPSSGPGSTNPRPLWPPARRKRLALPPGDTFGNVSRTFI